MPVAHSRTGPITCRDVRKGDILLKLSAGTRVNVAINILQGVVGMEYPDIVHAGVTFDSHYIIEASGCGIHANDLRVQNAGLRYLVFRCKNSAIADGAGTYAKVLLDIHQQHQTIPYNLSGALKSLVSKQAAPASRRQMDEALGGMLAGKHSPNFCSQFVAGVFHFAAEQNGVPARTLLNSADAVTPSRLTSLLRASPMFIEVGHLSANTR